MGRGKIYAGKAETMTTASSLEQRIEPLEAQFKQLQEKVRRMARTRKLPYDPELLEPPTNDCKKCDGTGHILGPEGICLSRTTQGPSVGPLRYTWE